MLEELDPHTVYFSGELAAMSENMRETSKALAEFIIQDDTLMVVTAGPGTWKR